MVLGEGCRVEGLEFRVEGSELRVSGLRFRVQGAGFRVEGKGCEVEGSGFRGLGFTGCGRFQARATWPSLQCRGSHQDENSSGMRFPIGNWSLYFRD